MDEFNIIRHFFAPLAVREPGAFGLTDDAASLQVPAGETLVITKDAIVEGVHFPAGEEPSLIARKLLRVNLSDIAAMGARPYAYFLALMLPEAPNGNWLGRFSDGLRQDQGQYGITLMGGDTTRTQGALAMSLTMLGLTPQGQELRRTGARAGDGLYVTGTLGDAALGLKLALGTLGHEACAHPEDAAFLLDRYRLPRPRLEIGQGLRGIATACMDISDGLLQDAGHIADCCGLMACIEAEKLPLSPSASALQEQMEGFLETVVAGGDDYELLFAAPLRYAGELEVIAARTGVPITCIGRMMEGAGVKIIDKTGADIYVSRKGYDHFSPDRHRENDKG